MDDVKLTGGDPMGDLRMESARLDGIQGLVVKGGMLQVRFVREGMPVRGFAVEVFSIPVSRNLGENGQVVCQIPMEALSSLLGGVPVKVMVDEQRNTLGLIAVPTAAFYLQVEDGEPCPAGFEESQQTCSKIERLRCQITDAKVHAAVSCLCSASNTGGPTSVCEAHQRLGALERELALLEKAHEPGPSLS